MNPMKGRSMTLFFKNLLTVTALSYSALACAGPTTCDPKEMGPAGCPSDIKTESKDITSPETCDSKDAKASECMGTEKEVFINPKTDVEIYQAVCIDPSTHRRWGIKLNKTMTEGSREAASEPAPTTARCQPDHDPKRHNPNGTDLGTSSFK